MMKLLLKTRCWLRLGGRHFFATLVLFLAILGHANACDVCGCGAGSINLGILPQWDKSILGLRYRTLAFDSHIFPDIYSQRFRTREDFTLMELWGKVHLSRKWQVIGFLPYFMARQQGQEKTLYRNGLADALVMGQYELLNTEITSPEKNVFHQLFVGGGLKLPTGAWRYDAETGRDVVNPNFQPGTGSYDGIGMVQYILRHKSVGLMTDAQYRYNGTNPDRYHFGNGVTGNLNIFWLNNFKEKRSLMLLTGLNGESRLQNSMYGYEVNFTGGNLLMAQIGCQAYWKGWSAALLHQTPLSQNLGNGSFKSLNRMQLQVSLGI